MGFCMIIVKAEQRIGQMGQIIVPLRACVLQVPLKQEEFILVGVEHKECLDAQ